MTFLVIVLLVLAAVFGVGAVVEGIAWALLVGFVLLVVGGWMAWQRLKASS